MVVLVSFYSILFVTNSLPVYRFRIRRHPEVARRLVVIISHLGAIANTTNKI